MNSVRSCLLLILIIFPAQSTLKSLESKERKSIQSKLKKLSEPTLKEDQSIRPDLSKMESQKQYVASIHSACLTLNANIKSYYSFENNDDIDELIKKLEKPINKSIFWYYYDKE